jgi:hypothetical protein
MNSLASRYRIIGRHGMACLRGCLVLFDQNGFTYSMLVGLVHPDDIGGDLVIAGGF